MLFSARLSLSFQWRPRLVSHIRSFFFPPSHSYVYSIISFALEEESARLTELTPIDFRLATLESILARPTAGLCYELLISRFVFVANGSGKFVILRRRFAYR